MKQTISKLILSLLCVMAGLTSCINDDLEPLRSYDSKETLANWQSEYTEDGSVYTISIKLDEKGDTTAVFYSDEEDGLYVCKNGVCSYNAAAGMTTIDFEDTPIGYPVRLYLARQSDRNRMTVYGMGIYNYNGQEYEIMGEKFNATPVKGCVVAGVTYCNSDETDFIQFLKDGTCNCLFDGDEENVLEGTYTYTPAAGEGTLTLTDGTVCTLRTNEKNQLVLTHGDKQTVLEVMSE